MEAVGKSLKNVINSKIKSELLLFMALCSAPGPVEEVYLHVFNLLLYVIK